MSCRRVEGLEVLDCSGSAGKVLVRSAQGAGEVRGVGREEGAAGDELVSDLGGG